MEKLFKTKLNKKGFTISETMVSIMILSLVVAIIGGGIIVVKNSYERITLKANAQVLISTTISKVNQEFRFAEDIETNGNSVYTETPYFVGTDGYRMSFVNKSDKGIMVHYSYGDESQESSLLTDKTMTDGLIPSIVYRYSKDDNLFSYTVIVKQNDKTIEQQEIKVRPLNN